jgi:GTPase
MSHENFIDQIRVFCKSGKGGAGSVHFHREKFIDRGGPDGGDGGRGGHVILRGNRNLWTLLHLRYKKHITAGDGINGASKNCTGAFGKDVFIEVPLGTIVKDEEGNHICEVTIDGEDKILFKGGRGGLGNINFKSATRQTPRFAQPGEEGIESWLIFELKVLADVGLVGFPNAGKSTLLSVITAAKPKIADYPFTTLIPNLGIVPYRDHRSFVMADIPGIIEDAHLGKGIGLRFLRHIERNSVLLFLIPADSPNPAKEYKVLLNELKMYNPELLDKERLIAISKSDLLDENGQKAVRKKMGKIPHLFISAHTQFQLDALKDQLWKMLN